MLHIKIENGKKVKTFSNSKEAEEYKLFLKTHKKPLSEESRKRCQNRIKVGVHLRNIEEELQKYILENRFKRNQRKIKKG